MMKRKTLALAASAAAIALVTAFTAMPTLAHGPEGSNYKTETCKDGGKAQHRGMMGKHRDRGHMDEHGDDDHMNKQDDHDRMGKHKGDDD